MAPAMRKHWTVFIAVGVGAVVAWAVWFVFGYFAWAIIHSGWSWAMLRVLYRLAPPLVGILTAIAVYYAIRGGRRSS